MSALTSWPDRAYNWEVYWHSLAGHFMLEYDPDMYHATMQRFRWRYDLGRQASGAFYGHVDHPSLDADDLGISLALAYTAPLKTLRITGAPRSEVCQGLHAARTTVGNGSGSRLSDFQAPQGLLQVRRRG